MDATTTALLVTTGGVVGAAVTKAVELIMSVRKAKREAATANHNATVEEWQLIATTAARRNDALLAQIATLQAELRASEMARARAEVRNPPPPVPPHPPPPYNPEDCL